MGGFHSHRSRRVWFLVVLALALFSLVSISVAAQEKITLTVATPWGDTTAFNGVFPALVEAYQQLRPDVEIEFLWGWSGEKIIAALAGGVLPDIVFGWGNTDEMREVFMPLDELMERKGVRLDDYLVGSIGQMHLLGKTWTLQVFIDPNFPLIYNKTMFAEAGLDPNQPPRTVAEFDSMFPKLTRRDASGALVQIAMPVWQWKDDYQVFNALSWGSAFGATLWEGTEYEGRFGISSPQMVAAFEWLKSHYDQYGPDAVNLVPPGWGGFVGRMINGQQAMVLAITPHFKELRRLAPNYEFSVAPPFHEEDGGFQYPIWFGGWSAGVTTQSKHPEEAFDFLVFMSYSPEGQEILARVGELFPATRESPGFSALVEETPDWLSFINALKVSTLSPATYWLNLDWGDVFAEVSHRIFNEGIAPHIALSEAEERLKIQARDELGLIVN